MTAPYHIMQDTKSSAFKNGHFIWDELNDTLLFVSRENRERINSAGSAALSVTSMKPVTQELRIRENIDGVGMAQYRKYFQRRVKINEAEVVTVQDIKDVALFITDPAEISLEFINYIHTSSMDKFFRSIIVYFQYYFQVWDKMQSKREEATKKLRHSRVEELEDIIRDNLSDLRSMVARNYAVVIMGLGDAHKYHHMANKNNVSLSDKDRKLFECLMFIAIRVVWIALYRKYLSLIEIELNRLLRTTVFSPIEHKRFSSNVFVPLAHEKRVLMGKAYRSEKKLKHRSPAVQELIFDDHDYRMLAIGVLDLKPRDTRQSYLEVAYEAPEDVLIALNVGVGILGIPRMYFDPMLKPIEKGAGKRLMDEQNFPTFELPPKQSHSIVKQNMSSPKLSCRYEETPESKTARLKQRQLWRNYITHTGAMFYSYAESTSTQLSNRASITYKGGLDGT